jgi:hypothetical protein
MEALRRLVAEGESERLEFKKTTGEPRSAMTTLCALLNGSGGKVLFGVTDRGKILGQDVTDATLREVAGEIRKIEPPAVFEQTRVPVREGKEVLFLETITCLDMPYIYDNGLPSLVCGGLCPRSMGLALCNERTTNPRSPRSICTATRLLSRIVAWGRTCNQPLRPRAVTPCGSIGKASSSMTSVPGADEHHPQWPLSAPRSGSSRQELAERLDGVAMDNDGFRCDLSGHPPDRGIQASLDNESRAGRVVEGSVSFGAGEGWITSNQNGVVTATFH